MVLINEWTKDDEGVFDGQVRDGAMSCLVEIYRHVGERVRLDLSKKGLPQSRYDYWKVVDRSGNIRAQSISSASLSGWWAGLPVVELFQTAAWKSNLKFLCRRDFILKNTVKKTMSNLFQQVMQEEMFIFDLFPLCSQVECNLQPVRWSPKIRDHDLVLRLRWVPVTWAPLTCRFFPLRRQPQSFLLCAEEGGCEDSVWWSCASCWNLLLNSSFLLPGPRLHHMSPQFSSSFNSFFSCLAINLLSLENWFILQVLFWFDQHLTGSGGSMKGC